MFSFIFQPLRVRKLNNTWNDEIRKRVKCPNILVHARKQKWLGHVLRIDDERIEKKVLQGKF